MKINFFKWLTLLLIVGIIVTVVLLVTSKHEYCIQFRADNTVVEEIYTAGKETIELPTAPVKQGYTFKGWYFDNGTWTNKLEETTYKDIELKNNVTVYAYYEQDEVVTTKYDITFMADGQVIETIKTSGNELITLPTAPPKQGYTFKGWYFDENTWTQKLEANTYENIELDENKTVYAYYEQDEVVATKYNITFMADGQVIETIKTSGNELITLPTAPVKQGYTFKGWYFDENTWTQKLEANTYESIELDENKTVYAYYEQDEVVAIEYIIDGNGNITGVNNIDGITELIIPNQVNGITVKSLQSYLFKNNKTLRHIELPDTILDVGLGTFQDCSNLNFVKLPANITVLYEYTFKNCTALKSITLPNTLIEIRSDCFRNSGLESIDFPDSLTDIWRYTFGFCENLSTVNLNKVEYIGDMAFQNCTNLTAIELPETLKDFGQDVFGDCLLLEDITLPDVKLDLYYSSFYNTKYFNTKSNWENEVLYIGKHLITVSRDFNAISYTVKEGTIDIAEGAFNKPSTKTLKTINIPESVLYIGKDAFKYMSTLSTANLPQNLIGIGKDAFLGTQIVSSTSSYWEGNYLYVSNYLIDIKETNIESIEIKEGTLGIIDGKLIANSYSSSVTSLTLPSSLKFIGKNNFERFKITNVVLPANLQIIGEKAFYYCGSLTSVDTSNCVNLTKICDSAFAGCNIAEITIPQTVEFIEGYIFNFNKNIIVNCQIPQKPPTWDDLWSQVNNGNIQINWGVI